MLGQAMAKQKLYAGTKLRELRRKVDLTQREFSERLEVSLPYLNQMENNNRPVSASVIIALADVFGFDVTQLVTGDNARLVSDMREVAADPIFGDDAPHLADLRMTANNAPRLARAFLQLHRAYRETHERLASLDEALGRADSRLQSSPWEEVRDFFHYCDNYIDAVDRAAERFAGKAIGTMQSHVTAELQAHGITLRRGAEAALRSYDPATKTLTLSAHLPEPTATFQMLIQLALLTQNDLLDATLDFARFHSPAARDIAKLGLANYYAGAALMPYVPLLESAHLFRHDLEQLAGKFGASVEQVAHRLSTLQRTGNKGVPFFFVRVDQAGTITKRHSATSLQFARFGGACPLWNVHRAFETPGQFLRQMAETPDGKRYFCLARDVTKTGGAWGAPVRRHAIGLGCEMRHARSLVYADGLNTGANAHFEPIGISCRICERRNCHQRSVPPLERNLKVDPDLRGVLPYQVS